MGVEFRFITKEQYEDLLDFFNKNARFLCSDDQETYYLDTNVDLRIQKNNTYSKIWIKKGKMHDYCREELEVHLAKEDFGKINQLFSVLGYKTKIKWLRKRNEFDWNGIKVDIDYTVGYGYILELEKMSTEKDKKIVYQELEKRFKELGIKQSDKKEFEHKYLDYEKNWKELTRLGLN